MALIVCPNCKNEISEYSGKCIKCGWDFQDLSKNEKGVYKSIYDIDITEENYEEKIFSYAKKRNEIVKKEASYNMLMVAAFVLVILAFVIAFFWGCSTGF